MSRKNIFDYATKELSQDAFLCWFIANCNDPIIQKYSYDFINFITGFNFKYGEIKKVQILQQEYKIDIVVDLWTSEDLNPLSHYVLIIEDKTTSSAHSNQLKRYADKMSEWNKNEPDYINRRKKIFYKTDYLSEEDKVEIEKGNKGYALNDQWKIIDIDSIHDFFAKIREINSEILSSYKEYVLKIFDDLNSVSNKPMLEWNFTNYETYFKEVIKNKFNYPKEKYDFRTGRYQGRLVNFEFIYCPQNPKFDKGVTKEYKSFAYPFIEFVVRKNSTEIAIHSLVKFHWIDNDNKERWTWKPAEYEPDVSATKDLVNMIRGELKKSPDVKILKMGTSKAQTISTDQIKISDSFEETENKIFEKLYAYFKVFEEIDKK